MFEDHEDEDFRHGDRPGDCGIAATIESEGEEEDSNDDDAALEKAAAGRRTLFSVLPGCSVTWRWIPGGTAWQDGLGRNLGRVKYVGITNDIRIDCVCHVRGAAGSIASAESAPARCTVKCGRILNADNAWDVVEPGLAQFFSLAARKVTYGREDASHGVPRCACRAGEEASTTCAAIACSRGCSHEMI